MTTTTTPSDIDLAIAALADWRPFFGTLCGRFRAPDAVGAARLATAIAEAAVQAEQDPDAELRRAVVTVRLRPTDRSGFGAADVALARHMSELAIGLGATAEPTLVTEVELGLDTPDHGRIKPFWQAVLGRADGSTTDHEVRDRDGGLLTMWFQASGADEPRQRFHLDVRVPQDVARQRIDATVAAGGTVVDEQPTFVVLADADGNKACVCF
jgi:4a-hydroxytetrahydrobiopterin dehydratase